ncbi:MAG: ABC transporter permease, partial [Bacilli bacterium]
ILGPISSYKRFANVIELMIPLMFTGLALSIVFKSKRFNLSADGAFYFGSMVATMVALWFKGPPVLVITVALIAAFIAGALIGYIPASIKQKFGADELVTSLMLNYIVGFFVKYLLNDKIRDTSSAGLQSVPIPPKVNLGRLVPMTRIHYGLIIILLLVVISWFFIYKTKWGYALRATGANENFARYSGMKVSLIVVLAQVIGTGIAGLGGAVEMLGMHKSFKWAEPTGYGFDGVIIATLARGNPIMVPLASFFLAYVRVGADILNRTSDIPAEIISVVQASLILLIAAKSFLARYRQKQIIKLTNALTVNTKEYGEVYE